LQRVAEVLDSINGNKQYQQVCTKLVAGFDDASLTYSAQVLEQMMEKGVGGFGRELSERYRQELSSQPLEVLSEAQLHQQVEESIKRQAQMEAQDSMPGAMGFEEYLHLHAGR
jgi:glutamate--cysteine ligase